MNKKFYFLIPVFILLLIFGFSIACDGNSEKINNTTGSNTTTIDTTAKSFEETTEVKKEPRVVIDLEGNSNKRSQLFHLNGGTQALGYIVVGNTFPMCSIYVLEEGVDLNRDGGFPEVMVTENVKEVELTYMYKTAGNYYVEVSSANCNWKLRIVEEE
jgi:hypothetical protein